MSCWRTPGRLVKALSMPGAAARRLVNTGVVCSAKRPRRSIAGPSCLRNGGEVFEVLGERATMSGSRLRDLVACSMKSATCWRTFANGASALSESTASFGEHVVLAGEDRQHAVEFLQRGVGPFDHFVQVAPAAGEAGAEFVDDDRQALAFGQPADVAEQIDVDGAVGVLHGQQVLAFAFMAFADLLQRRRQRRAFHSRLGGQAVDVLLADQRLRADGAAGVGAEVLEARVFDVQHDRGLGGGSGCDRADRADLDAVDLDVLAGDDVAGVVEDRADSVGRRSSRRPRWPGARRARARRRQARRWHRPPISSARRSPSSPRSFLALPFTTSRATPPSW